MTAQALANVFFGRQRDSVEAMSDADLVEKSKAGDLEYFNELVRRHHVVVYNLAYRYMRDGNLAEDMTQEAFLKGFRMLSGFRGDCSFSTWMYRVTSSVCLTELNRRKRRNEVAFSPAHAKELSEQPDAASDTAEIIRRCVSKLPERYAKIITMYYLQEIAYEEIAEVMDIPLGTLKTWMHRARKQLRAIVEKEVDVEQLDAIL